MTKEISQLPASSGVQSTDLFATKKGADDFRATATQVSDFTLGNLSDQDVMDKMLNVDSDTSGLNANTLQGEDKSFFQNATNLISGLIPEARLPAGTLTSSDTATTSRNVWKLPTTSAGGTGIMIQFGYTAFIGEGNIALITYPETFASGFGNDNLPITIVSPECDADSPISGPSRVELDIRLYERNLSSFRAAAVRTGGSGLDLVRGHYIAIGMY